MAERYRILAGPGSPYSHKVRAVLRYRRIPHEWVIMLGGFDGSGQMGALQGIGKRMLPVVQYPDGSYWNDSTPIIEELDATHAGREVLPPDPANRFLARLIEDFADEWLPSILMAYRWTSDEDVAFCARRQMSGWLGAVDEPTLAAAIGRMTARQQMVRDALGGAGPARAVFDADYLMLLEILEQGMAQQLFLFGDRPSIADFGLYGMLSQFAADPTPQKLMRERAVRTWQWVNYADDLSGHDGEWGKRAPAVARLVALASESFLPMMEAVTDTLARGERLATYEARGVPMRALARDYPAQCWLCLKAMYAALAPDARASLTDILGSRFIRALAFKDGEEERVQPLQKL